MDTLYTTSMVVIKQVNDVSVKSNSLIFTADLRNYFLVSFVHDICNYNKKVSLFISLQAKLQSLSAKRSTSLKLPLVFSKGWKYSMVLQRECSARPAGPPGAMSVHASGIKGLNTQLPPCFCIRTHLHVLPLSRGLVTQGVTAGLQFQLLG